MKEDYLLGWDDYLYWGVALGPFYDTQIVPQEIAERFHCYARMRYDASDLLAEVALFLNGVQEPEDWIEDSKLFKGLIGTWKYEPRLVHQLFRFLHDEDGPHQLGGEIPDGFQIPANPCPGSFQYLGCISLADPTFAWLPFDLHLICPIYMNFDDPVLLDYSDPMAPQLVDAALVAQYDTHYPALQADSEIVYRPMRFRSEAVPEFMESFGGAGVPNWVQFPTIPTNPATGRALSFVCQIGSDATKTLRTNVVAGSRFMQGYFERMNFWGSGNLFVFMDPATRIVGYYIQTT